jgi:hypothetical protein
MRGSWFVLHTLRLYLGGLHQVRLSCLSAAYPIMEPKILEDTEAFTAHICRGKYSLARTRDSMYMLVHSGRKCGRPPIQSICSVRVGDHRASEEACGSCIVACLWRDTSMLDNNSYPDAKALITKSTV